VYCTGRAKLEKWLISAIRLLSTAHQAVHPRESLGNFTKGWDHLFSRPRTGQIAALC
jgi:hypothetical protein